MTTTEEVTSNDWAGSRGAADSAYAAADTWLSAVIAGLSSGDSEAIEALFTSDATWRDFMSTTWDIRNHFSAHEVAAALTGAFHSGSLRALTITDEQLPQIEPAGDVQHLVLFVDFDGANGPSSGYIRLVEVDEGLGWKALSCMTQLESIRGQTKISGPDRPQGKVHGVVPYRPRWKESRERERAFVDEEPQVIVLGAGHCGLAVAARLKELGVATLVLEKNERVGDNWRNRYASLALHDPIAMDHMPYIPFPSTWPKFTPKDKFADFLESYAQILELNVWTSSEMLDLERLNNGTWRVRIRQSNGEVRELHPRHVVVATGLNGQPNIPEIAGSETFGGPIVHSGDFAGGEEWNGKRALVVGSGVSGHEVAMDLHEYGAHVTMLQRSSSYVVNVKTFHKYLLGLYVEGGRPPKYADQIANGVPNATSADAQKFLTAQSVAEDKDLLDRLAARGFAIDYGPDGRGVVGSHLAGRDAYHINIGAAELIAEGHIAIKQGVEISRVEPGRVIFTDGSHTDADLIVLATGYHGLLDSIRPILGNAADKIQRVYGLADDGEYSETWRQSRQEGLWFATGFIVIARFYSHFLALQIQASELGLLSHPDSDVAPPEATSK